MDNYKLIIVHYVKINSYDFNQSYLMHVWKINEQNLFFLAPSNMLLLNENIIITNNNFSHIR